MNAPILFVASNPTAIRFDFAGELAVIERLWLQSTAQTQVRARWSVSVDGLKRLVTSLRPSVVHLLSPGVVPETNAMILSNARGQPEYAAPETLAAAFSGRRASAPAVVVLNTCHSHAHAAAIAPHVGCVVAMDGLIYDTAAIAFTEAFYGALAEGVTVRKAFEQGRAAVGSATPAQQDVPVLLAGRQNPAAITFARRVARAPVPVSTSQAAARSNRCVQIFCSYSHKDEKYRGELETHLALLVRQGAVKVWHDRLIGPGHDWAREIDENLDHAGLVLLLISADFLASEYCFGLEMERALQRERAALTRVVPILVRKCDLEGVPFGHLQWLPTGSRPVKNWTDRNSAWTDVAAGVRRIVQEIEGPGSKSLTR